MRKSKAICESLDSVRERILRANPLRLLLAAACLHILTVVAIYGVGRLSLLPGAFTSDGFGQLASDSSVYQREAHTLVEVLSHDGVGAWLRVPVEFHVHLYSLAFAIFSPLFGYSVLAVEPLNLLYYLASLLLTYRIGEESFGKLTGLIAATIIALWLSFLLHTTHVLKDPLFIACTLVLVFACVMWLRTQRPWKSALLATALGMISLTLLARMKSNMWESIVIIVGIGVLLLLAQQARARRFFVQNMVSATLLVAVVLIAPVKETRVHGRDRDAINIAEQTGQTSLLWKSFGARIARRRRTFSYLRRRNSSTIDPEISFNSTGDIVRYIPRAALIGLLAPFPEMWLASGGSTGRAPRLLGGMETFLFYFAALAAGVCLWVERRNLTMWFLLLVALINMIALGLVVTNIGALFRLRYVFWMLIIILGTRGAVILIKKFCTMHATHKRTIDAQGGPSDASRAG